MASVLSEQENCSTWIDGNIKIVHFVPSKSKRVCKSVLAAELLAFVNGFDIGYVIAHSLGEIVGRETDLVIYTGIHSLYEICILLARTTELRLQTDLAFELGVIREERYHKNSVDSRRQ